MKVKKISLGLFGFGTVGQGFYQLVKKGAAVDIEIIRIAVKDPKKERTLDRSAFTFDYRELLYHPDIELIVEATDDEKAGYEIIKTALIKGIPVVSANKKLIALHLAEFITLSKETQTPLLYEAAAAGAIPIITSLDNYFNNEELSSVKGIVNGTTNYILSTMLQQGVSFENALKKAQELGFAESDPKNDVDAYDAAFKLILISVHAFGKVIKLENILRYGIRHINNEDHLEANKLNKTIKLIAHVFPTESGIEAMVLPTYVDPEDDFAQVSAEFNAVEIVSIDSGKHFLKGKGAGSLPTGSALLNDVVKAINGGYNYKNISNNENSGTYEIEVTLTGKNKFELQGLLSANNQLDNSNNNPKATWINTKVLRVQIKTFEENEISLITTGRIRKVPIQDNSTDLNLTKNSNHNRVIRQI